VLERLAAEGGGSWVLAKIDVDANPVLAQGLRVQGIPAVKAVWQGQLVAEFTGAIPEEQAREFVTELVRATGGAVPGGVQDGGAPIDDPRLDEAEAALERGDLAAAEEATGRSSPRSPTTPTPAWRSGRSSCSAARRRPGRTRSPRPTPPRTTSPPRPAPPTSCSAPATWRAPSTGCSTSSAAPPARTGTRRARTLWSSSRSSGTRTRG
jgi:hypothetical protein